MSTAEPLPVRILEGRVPYSDGSEQRILEVLGAASDRSSDSDELAAAITDWPSRYHLSRQRANLLMPLRIGPQLRVLEIGAGTGVLSRYLAECGAEVVALEGSLDRARATAVRCAGLDNVEVVCGSLESFTDPEGFDLVCIVGVLEYSASGAGGLSAHQGFLERAAALRRPKGALLVAIENQIGVKYLLGYREDHLGLPWIGLEGYPGNHGIRTFTRRTLAQMLAAAGLPAQAWLYPFPDYKLPSVVLTDGLYDLADAPDLVDHLVRHPVADDHSERILLCDDRRAHQVLLEAGLGRDVANSFLVLAAAEGDHPTCLPDPGVLAWRLGDDRRRSWRRHVELRSSSAGLTIRTVAGSRGLAIHRESWLTHDPTKDESFVLGPTVEELALDACRRRDRAALAELLGRWRAFLDEQVEQGSDGGMVRHPFLAEQGSPQLSAEYLDVALPNFVLGHDGLHFVDREWRAEGGVAEHLVMLRALWLFASELVRSGIGHPWPSDTTVRELSLKLGELCGLEPSDAALDQLLAAEVEYQQLVTGRDPESLREDQRWLSRQSRSSSEVIARLPITELRRSVDELCHRGDELQSKLVELQRRFEALGESSRLREHELDHQLGEARGAAVRLAGHLAVAHEHLANTQSELERHRNELGSAREQLAGTLRELEAHRRELASARAELEMWRRARQAFESRLPVRIYRWLRRILGR